jgi:excisionase family DNA binding protein
MPQKFISLADAAQQLGISRDHLNQLREKGKLRAYRDGASWKFRAEDVARLAAEGVPPPSSPSSVLNLGAESKVSAEGPVSSSGMDLDRAEEESAVAATSDIDLEEIDEPTVPAGVSGANLSDEAVLESDDENALSDSILLSEAELGGGGDRPPSTIIGKAELDAEADLITTEGSQAGPESDVRLASPASDVLASGTSEDVFGTNLPSPSGSFDQVEELEVDLEAESSRVLGPDVASKAKAAAKVARAAADTGDLELAPGSSVTSVGSGVGLGGEGGETGLTGLSSLELESPGDEDEQVLGEASSSDITLSGESSGINIISPSDSGLALDEVPLDLSGGAMGSSLDLGDISAEEEEDVELEPLDIGEAKAPQGSGVEAFQLTPLGEEAEEEEKDSSQIIALEEISEEDSAAASAESAAVGAEMLTDEFGVVGLATGGGGAAAVVEPVVETPFSTPVIVFLGLCILLLAVCGMMVFDLIRNMWSWDQIYSVNSSLLDALYPLIN